MAKGKLIVFEGVDNCGKDSIISNLSHTIGHGGRLVKTIPSVSTTQLGRLIRLITMRKSEMRANNRQLVPLFIADFYNKLDLIEEYISMGYIVLCSRWYTTTLAYCDSDTDKMAIKSLIKTDIKPDILFYLKISLETFEKRQQKSGKLMDVYSNKPMIEQAMNVYDKILNEEYNTIVVDADLSKTTVIERVRFHLLDEGVINGNSKSGRIYRGFKQNH